MNRGIHTDASDAIFRCPDGEPYLPSNGTEGEIFMGHWCERCHKDQFDAGGDGCPILLKSLLNDQPAEWVYRDGSPICTAFEEAATDG